MAIRNVLLRAIPSKMDGLWASLDTVNKQLTIGANDVSLFYVKEMVCQSIGSGVHRLVLDETQVKQLRDLLNTLDEVNGMEV